MTRNLLRKPMTDRNPSRAAENKGCHENIRTGVF